MNISLQPQRHVRLVLATLVLCALCLSLTPLSASAATKKPTITLISPKAKEKFSKSIDGSIPIVWSAKNVPENTLAIIEIQHRKLAKGSTIGGGAAQVAVPPGNITGTYNWDIETVGSTDAGTYKVRVLLQECSPKGCNFNPNFPGEKKTRVYAKSKWKNITVTNTASTNTTDTVTNRGPRGPVSVALTLNGTPTDTVILGASDEATFLYFPSGDVDSCTIVAEYTEGARSVTHSWKNQITPGQFGRATFSAVNLDGSLREVKARCKNTQYETTDSISITTAASPDAAYKILTGHRGEQTYKYGTGTEAEARAYCSKAYNDPSIHQYTRVQCYWNGDKFIDEDAFKG